MLYKVYKIVKMIEVFLYMYITYKIFYITYRRGFFNAKAIHLAVGIFLNHL